MPGTPFSRSWKAFKRITQQVLFPRTIYLFIYFGGVVHLGRPFRYILLFRLMKKKRVSNDSIGVGRDAIFHVPDKGVDFGSNQTINIGVWT